MAFMFTFNCDRLRLVFAINKGKINGLMAQKANVWNIVWFNVCKKESFNNFYEQFCILILIHLA